MNALFSALNRLWRIAMTGVCFTLFSLGGLLLSVVWFNVLLICVRDPVRRRRLARRSIAASFRLFLSVTRLLGVLDYRMEGVEILRQDRGCLVVANHPTLIDYVLLASVMPETDCLVKSALLKNPFLSGVVHAADYLVNSQADALLPASQQRLAQGDTILIFPEGTRTRPGEAMTLQRGAANIAVRCHSDLRVVTIHCSERMLDKESKWYQVPPVKPLFTVEVRERLKINHFYDADSPEPALAARRLNRHLLLKLQPCTLSLSGLNDASALSRN
ncbi:lysophospholipid acyltransferase family protein [Citrobacter rodentium]|uniref:Acyltransferase n=2 Tax=Citrobacter rodentium TaxID=67825 RepID=D2TKS2_CITRI|nr:lysophospholipid acyltransferase family protein [Citrobacter rodentium]KIQ50630.1 acyl-phosphate glycerol 3-phosphate acyltransferase [Citrobacter rodentium]QBY30613.1 1-acyl-sn-glycerol-3-phosphate acyltransferase [Citrobacter rodentium]UHO32017.1 1-acyl-sn-glycerol-3-phosphate acyltransferase [Citrobacter rodentium NBRC 105723 = DSM 16636]CBG91036.1 putative acyltransferase [Citrobacter rodentium ICC168]HAT8011336.1 1-acyl-sn-glycerol-3-phosphate acyltransferase [Citrobacter rodentium NBR